MQSVMSRQQHFRTHLCHLYLSVNNHKYFFIKLFSPLLPLSYTALKMSQIIPKTAAQGAVTKHSLSTWMLTQQAAASELWTCDQAKCGRSIIYPCLIGDEETLFCTSFSFFSILPAQRSSPTPLKGHLFNPRDTKLACANQA